jgi:hypothetical protein
MKNQFLKWSLALSLLMVVGTTNLLIANESSDTHLTKAPKNITWIDIVIDSGDVTLEDLASTYYGDVKEADFIYEHNREVISKDRQLREGMKLKIVVTDKFVNQPQHLGWH